MKILIAATAAAWLGAACLTIEDESSPSKPKGGVGESCGARVDCASGLGCFDHVCLEPDASAEGAAVGQLGDSCSANTDCAAELFCQGGRCTALGTDAGSTDSATSGDAAVGEACTDTLDCAENLSCVRGVCTGSEHGLLPSDRECVTLECREAADCCSDPPYMCSYYQQQCDAGDAASCSFYNKYCVCDLSRWECANDTCSYTEPCGEGGACPSGLTCDGSACVECTSDADCATGEMCRAKACVEHCTQREDCPLFHDCISGECVDQGCSTDRECIVLSDDPFASCVDGSCRESCVRDSDCNSYVFQGQVCFEGHCFPMGCETDEECRAALQGNIQGKRVECRPAP